MKGITGLTLLLLLIAAGCVEVDEQFTLKTDGSGTVEVKYSIPERTVEQIKAVATLEKNLARAAGAPAATSPEYRYELLFLNPDEKTLKKELDQLKSYGIELESLKMDTREGKRSVRLKLKFSDLSKAVQTELFGRYGFMLTRTRDGNFLLYRDPWGKPSEEAIRTITDQKTVRELTPLLAGFKYELKVRVPGRIIDSNAATKALYNAMWTFSFDDDPSAVLSFQTRRLSVMFEGTGLRLPDATKKRSEGQEREAAKGT